ncbi:hypothetical protein CRI94_09550 [Longibacter salinarum]|uniref:Uncharacterized protein n=1 Tax=Longibacter salinarum TaxID=1850348 RepID=A0A2A8CY15_9BACT|nr:hypothetical protein [Longibacter salinarum]PEN13546.1 hypothetical protein CRI94_09550 [Longibacter salinarum]
MMSSENSYRNPGHASDARRHIASSLIKAEAARLRAEVKRLKRENERLTKERRALIRENRSLRREATLVRLYRAHDDQHETAEIGEKAELSPIPAPAADLYDRLPTSFTFANYFRFAAKAQLDSQTARSCLTYYLDEGLLIQVGSRLRKTDIVMRHTNG